MNEVCLYLRSSLVVHPLFDCKNGEDLKTYLLDDCFFEKNATVREEKLYDRKVYQINHIAMYAQVGLTLIYAGGLVLWERKQRTFLEALFWLAARISFLCLLPHLLHRGITNISSGEPLFSFFDAHIYKDHIEQKKNNLINGLIKNNKLFSKYDEKGDFVSCEEFDNNNLIPLLKEIGSCAAYENLIEELIKKITFADSSRWKFNRRESNIANIRSGLDTLIKEYRTNINKLEEEPERQKLCKKKEFLEDEILPYFGPLHCHKWMNFSPSNLFEKFLLYQGTSLRAELVAARIRYDTKLQEEQREVEEAAEAERREAEKEEPLEKVLAPQSPQVQEERMQTGIPDPVVPEITAAVDDQPDISDFQGDFNELCRAVQGNDQETINKFVNSSRAKLLINEKDFAGKTLLYKAVDAKNLDIVQLLVDVEELDLNLEPTKLPGSTPLVLALVHCQLEIAKFLLDTFCSRKDDPNFRLDEKPYIRSLYLSYVAAKVYKNDTVIPKIRTVIKKFDSSVPQDSSEQLFLYTAMYGCDFLLLKLFKPGSKKLLSAIFGSIQDTPLMLASKGGYETTVETILEQIKGCYEESTRIGKSRSDLVNAKNKQNKTALIYAAEAGSLSVIKQLLDNDAKVDVLDKERKSPTTIILGKISELIPGKDLPSDPKDLQLLDEYKEITMLLSSKLSNDTKKTLFESFFKALIQKGNYDIFDFFLKGLEVNLDKTALINYCNTKKNEFLRSPNDEDKLENVQKIYGLLCE